MAAETYNVYHNPSHRWYYLNEMEACETHIFKSFDSRKFDGTARGELRCKIPRIQLRDHCALVCPHAAFNNTAAPVDARARESVECLAVVVYPEGTGSEEKVIDCEVSRMSSSVWVQANESALTLRTLMLSSLIAKIRPIAAED